MTQAPKPSPSTRAKKPSRATKQYVAPKLVEYGSTSKLNAAKPGSFSDGSNTIFKTCL